MAPTLQVRAGQVPELPPESLPPALHALLLKCLSFAPADRPTDDEVLQVSHTRA